MDDLVKEIQTLQTLPGAIDEILQELRELYQVGDLRAMVKVLNTRAYHTGRQYHVTQDYTGTLSVTWVRV